MKSNINIGLEVKSPTKSCEDKKCPYHGELKPRGRIFTGIIKSKDPNKTATVYWERLSYLKKYERYEKRRTKLKVHNPSCINADVGDTVKIMETRPISKTKKFVIIENESIKS